MTCYMACIILLFVLLLNFTCCVDIISTIAGSNTQAYSGDNAAATAASLYYPLGIRLDAAGNVYIADTYNNRVRKVTVSTGIITNIAGNGGIGSYSGDNGAATSAMLYYPSDVAVDSAGNVYIVDNSNHCIRKVAISTGIITTIAGTGTTSYLGDNVAATSATLYYPYGVTLDSAGNVYIADQYNNRIRKVTVSTGIITTVAGIGTTSYDGDNGPATSSTLHFPCGVALDSAGNIYIADKNNYRIRKVTVSTGIITTIAGSGSSGYSGDNGPATSATLFDPVGVALDSSGNIYIADECNHRIRKVTVLTGIITTIAGTGTASYSGDSGQATSAGLNYPWGVNVDSSGNVYIADTNNNRIRKVTMSTATPSASPTLIPSTMLPTTSTPSSNYPSQSPSIGIITTIAGTGSTTFLGDNGQATSAGLYYPEAVCVDAAGNLYIADYWNQRIRKVTVSTGIITTIAGTGSTTYSGDNGAATSATLNFPSDVAVDSAGNVYIADAHNHRIRKVTISTGIITTIAGTGTSGSYSGDNGPATSAALNLPCGVAIDTSSNVYIADSLNNRVRKVTISTGIITTIAGSGASSFSGDNGQATAATLKFPTGVALDSAGNIYFADSQNHRIRKVTVPTDIITTIAGTGTSSFSGDNGPATSAAIFNPYGVAVDSSGNVYIADLYNHCIRKVTVSTGIINTIAGSSASGSYSGDNGPATSSALCFPYGVTVDSSGNVYIADTDNNRIRKVTMSTATSTSPTLVPSTSTPTTSTPSSYPSLSPSIGIITTIAGTGSATYSGDNGQATDAALYYPYGVALDAAGDLYIADEYNCRIRKVTVSTGIITTIAGSSTSGSYSGDNGPATSATIHQPRGVVLDSAGNLYIVEHNNHRIRKVTVSTGIITTIAGTGTQSYSGDNGPATSATLNYPYGVGLDKVGNVYIADSFNHRIRKVTVSTGIITTFSGTGTASYSGDNGPVTSASLYYPTDVTFDSAGNAYIADRNNNRVRKVTVSTGIITTIAGTGTSSYSGDNGPATSAALYWPWGVALDASGNIYIADWNNNRIRKVTISTGIITTIAGTGSADYSGDNGQATSAALNYPSGVNVDSSGNVYIADTNNHRIRKVTVSTDTSSPSTTPTLVPSTMIPTTSTPSSIPSQSPSIGIITTIAGTGSASYSGDNGQATDAGLKYPIAVRVDATGNYYIADSYNHCIRKVTASTGIITTIAGTGTSSYSGDTGPATSAGLNQPFDVAVDSVGNVYIADASNNRIRKVTVSTGIITTLAGTGTASYSGDGGAATSAALYIPEGVTLDSTGNVYIADTGNNRIRKVTASTGIITTIAGTETGNYSGDNGQATSAALNGPIGIALDSAGNVYISDYVNQRIRKVTVSSGIITTIAGTGTSSYSGDNGPATSAALQNPYGIALDSAGNVYIADTYNCRVRKVTVSTGIITTFAGTGTSSYDGDNGQATSASLKYPTGVALDSADNVYIADYFNNRIRKVTVSTATSTPSMSPTFVPSTMTPTISTLGIITTIAGTGTSSYSGDGGPATAATLYCPRAVRLDAAGNVYIADLGNNRIRKLAISTGIITTIAGSSTSGSYSGDGNDATSATLDWPIDVALDSAGNLYIADYFNHRIRKVTASTGFITTITGTGTSSYSGDNGPATEATLCYPTGVELDSAGNVYIADASNNRIRKVTTSTGIITTIAGTGTSSYSGDGGAAISATLYGPCKVALDSSGNVYIADAANNRIRKVTVSTGIITTIAGTGSTTYSGDNGPATSAALNGPQGVSLDSAGNVYIADTSNNRVRKVTISTGIITLIAGTGTGSYSGDNGQATAATLYWPMGVALDSADNVYIADYLNNRVRKVTMSTATSSPSTSPTMIPTTSTIGIITTIAGTGSTTYSGDNGQATSAGVNHPLGVDVDTAGNVYIAEYGNNRIRKVTVSTGIISTIAGSGGSNTYSGDGGAATSAALNLPLDVAVDSAGNVYIADYANHRIRKVTVSTGIITTIAGTGTPSYSGDNGPATSATFNYPDGVALDSAGNIYIADHLNHRIRKVTVSSGIITTIAGTGTSSYSGDNGPATSATVSYPFGVAVDSTGNVYIADYMNNRIRKVTVSTGIITTIAGTGGTGSYSGDNVPATATTLQYPSGVALDSAGNVYIADQYNQRIRKVTVSTGIITTYAGTGTASYSGDGEAATSATLNGPKGIALDASGNVYIADESNNRIRKVTLTTATSTPSTSPTLVPSTSTPTTSTPSSNYPSLSPSIGIITTIAGTGTGTYSGDNGQATAAGLWYPAGVYVDTAGNVYIADYSNHRIRKVTVSTGIITTIAGNGTASYSGDNEQATAATLYWPSDVALDSTGDVYISDYYNHRVRKVTVSTGIITTIAGTGTSSYSGDNGPATSATLWPDGVAVDASGNIYISDVINHRIRKVTVSTGIITTIAGTGTDSYSGDGGAATSAGLNYPIDVALDSAGNVYIADFYNQRIRKVTVSTGIITTIAGSGGTTGSYSGDNGQATSATLNCPQGVAVDSSGNVYIADTCNHRIREVTVSTGIITTIAGSSTSGSYSGDNGPATSAALDGPKGIAVDSAGNVYIADTNNHRIRKVTMSTATSTPSLTPSASPTALPSTMSPTSTPSTTKPTFTPTSIPSAIHTLAPSTSSPSFTPTRSPSGAPSYSPSGAPSYSPSGAPSYSPSSTPSVLPTTMQPSSSLPSFTPTLSPSAYPTYSSSVRVYFTITQGFVGISASTYSNSKVSNDALFKQTVASMLGYDSRKEDVTIQLVTDVVQSRRSLSTAATAVQVCEVMYSIATPTFIFNDTNHATAMFIHALNESIAMGAFDLVLHANSGSSWQSTTTEYVIFSTTSPTSSPTSTPTSAPTKRDNVVVNLLTVPIDDKVAKAKIKYYLGAFMGYFLAIYICLYLYSFLRYGKFTASKLYDSSYNSELHIRCTSNCSSMEQGTRDVILLDLLRDNAVIQNTMKLEQELRVMKSSIDTYSATGNDTMHSASISGKLASIVTMEGEDKYSKGYREYMQQQRTLLGCSAFLYQEGYLVKIPCVSREIVFPPGRVENILLYICHNHPLFSCFYFMDGSKLGAHGTRILYIGKDIAVFVLYQFSNMLLQYFMLDGHGLGTFINLFIITPSAVSIGLLLKYLYTCPFTETVEFQRRYAKYELTVRLLGRLAIVPIMLIMFGSLIIACLFSSNRDVPMILVNYFVFVQFYGVILATVRAMLLFVDNYYYKLSLFGVLDVLCIGKMFKERILAEQLVVDVDYTYRINTYLFGIVKVQQILNRDNAIKAKWITTGGGGVVPTEAVGGNVYDIEMTGADETVISVQMNPLTSNETERSSVAFSMDGIFDDGGYSVYSSNPSSNSSNDQVIAIENPIHSLAVMLNTANPHPASIHQQEAPQKQPVTARSHTEQAGDAAITAGEDDAALYLEYQTLHENRDEALYAMDGDNEIAVSFEEWKSERKQFKQGTRGSFVKAFQVFEEREQLALEQLEQVSHSASVKNTLKLHSNKVKNVLAATRAFSAAGNKPK